MQTLLAISVTVLSAQLAFASNPINNGQIEIHITTNQLTVRASETITIDVYLKNRTLNPIFIRNEQNEDWPNLLPCFRNVKSGEYLRTTFIASHLPPPESKHAFLKLLPGVPFHISLPISLSDFTVTQSGQYKFWIQYRNVLSKSSYFGLPTLDNKKPAPYSNMVVLNVSNQ